MPQLVILTGPIAAGKNTVADRLTQRLTGHGHTVVIADVDDVAAMVGAPGAGEAGLWFAAHEAHGALVGQWVRSSVDYVVAVGPFWTAEEQGAAPVTLKAGDVVRVIVSLGLSPDGQVLRNQVDHVPPLLAPDKRDVIKAPLKQ